MKCLSAAAATLRLTGCAPDLCHSTCCALMPPAAAGVGGRCRRQVSAAGVGGRQYAQPGMQAVPAVGSRLRPAAD